jgi:hypothetical protein
VFNAGVPGRLARVVASISDEQPAAADESVDCCGRGVADAEERLTVDLAHKLAGGSTIGLGLITCRSSTNLPGLTASTIRPRTSTTSSGSTHQSDQEKTTKSYACGSSSISLPEATS